MSNESVSLNEVEAQLSALQEGQANAWDAIESLQNELEKIKSKQRQLHEEQGDILDTVENIDARTDLLRLVESSNDMTAKQRQIALIEHLRQEAIHNRERGREAKASVNQDQAKRALQHPNIDRTTYYSDMQRAEELVDDTDMLRYEGSNGRLMLNLEVGELPSEVTDHNGGK